jgi:hypothetical protein
MPEIETKPVDELRQRRYRQAAVLLTRWAHEDPAYDERVGTELERELKADGMRCGETDENPS